MPYGTCFHPIIRKSWEAGTSSTDKRCQTAKAKRMQKGFPQPIGEILKGVVESLNKAQDKGIAKIAGAWVNIAGKELARHTKPLDLRKKILKVLVDDSAWFYQANLDKEKLIAKLQNKLGSEKIQTIQFRIGKIKEVARYP